ncbi:hypothetical protein RJ55_08471 [Drechmeria coniospora]|nr:hypothetical protein RJ55_08471 [Drechmeria coniospora]
MTVRPPPPPRRQRLLFLLLPGPCVSNAHLLDIGLVRTCLFHTTCAARFDKDQACQPVSRRASTHRHSGGIVLEPWHLEESYPGERPAGRRVMNPIGRLALGAPMVRGSVPWRREKLRAHMRLAAQAHGWVGIGGGLLPEAIRSKMIGTCPGRDAPAPAMASFPRAAALTKVACEGAGEGEALRRPRPQAAGAVQELREPLGFNGSSSAGEGWMAPGGIPASSTG